MEACDHIFLSGAIGYAANFYNKCILCGKSMGEIMIHDFMGIQIPEPFSEPQHVAFIGHELHSK